MKKLQYLFLLTLVISAACKEPMVDPTLPQLSISDINKFEGEVDNVFTLTVTLIGDHEGMVSVSYQTTDSIATSGDDYVAISNQTLSFAAGENTKSIEITVIGDDVKEGDEAFNVTLFDPQNATLLKGIGVVNIRNDDTGTSSNGIPTTGYTTPETYPNMTLVWADEFTGTTLNTDNWVPEIGTGDNGWGNNELQYYRAENTSIVEENLVITAKQEFFGGSSYTSSRLITKDKQDFTYGRIDIRAVLPEGQGLWPALWMLGSNFTTVGWPACGEIDIMELVGHEPGTVHGTIHYGPNFSQRQYTGSSRSLSNDAKFSEEFHVFSLIWEENKIQWLVDDVAYYQITDATTGGFDYPFNKDFFFIFNVAVGGQWPGSPNATTIFPQRMIVDYVRVFQ